MKKSFVLFITILLLGTSVVFFGQNMILAEKDNVKITENVLYGDKSVVEGVKLDLHNHYETQIFWDTTYQIGENPKTNTNYTFHQWRQNNQEYSWNGAIHFYNDMQEIGWDNSTVHASEGLETAIKELQDSIGASETGTKMFLLKDYKDYYTFNISFQTSHSAEAEKEIHFNHELSKVNLKRELSYADKNKGKKNGYSEDGIDFLQKQLKWTETFHEFFKIPVLENEAYIISMRKSENGNIGSWSWSTTNSGMAEGEIDIPEFSETENFDNFEFATRYFVGDGDVYMTFNTRSNNNVVVDTSLIPGGYGIYHFPYDLEKEELYPEQLKMVYALDPNIEVVDLTRDARGENLLLFTIEDTEIYMSVIDIKTMTLVDKFSISESREDIYGLDYYVAEEDYMVIATYGDIIVFTIDENGTYVKEFETSREPLKQFSLPGTQYYPDGMVDYYEPLQYDTVYDWNGKQLVFANNMYNVNGYMGTGFYVGVLDANGLQYFATYDTSLQSPISKDENGDEVYDYAHVRPVEYEPIVLKWE